VVEAIVTLVTTVNETRQVAYLATKVYRLEFDSEEAFALWMQSSSRFHLLAAERLTGTEMGSEPKQQYGG
jgi:antibiotic biosynthesis monooxygenase (ABM) superfamily enzyme